MAVLAWAAATAQADPAPRRSVSYSTWLLEDDVVTARVVLPAAEAASLVGKAMPLLSTENLAKYVLKSVSVTAGGSSCQATDQGYDIGKVDALSLGSGLYGFEIIFRCSLRGALSLNNAVLFAEEPQHIGFARIERDGVHTGELFTAAHHVLIIAREGELPAAGADRYLELGSRHAGRSAPWLCAMLGFFMLARARRQLVTVLASLATGYAAAILVTAGGLLPDVALLDAGMGFVVACVAALLVAQALCHEHQANTAPAVARGASVLILGIVIFGIVQALLHRPSAAVALIGFVIVGATLVGATLVGAPLVGAPLVGAAPARTAPARTWDSGGSLPIAMLPALAGLIDGLVLPGDYERLGQWSDLSLRNLAAFDAGAWLIGALMLGALAALAHFIIGRAARFRIRPETFASLAGDIAASVFAGLGSFWLLSRLY
jgi:hypothetical protein